MCGRFCIFLFLVLLGLPHKPVQCQEVFGYSHQTPRFLRSHAYSGSYLGALNQPPPVYDYFGMALSPDGLLYFCTANDDIIHRFDPITGDHDGLFEWAPPPTA